MKSKSIRIKTYVGVEYRVNCKRHREDGPAVIWFDGNLVWHKHGEIHREDGPAIIHSDGTMIWCKDGECHRDNGPAYVYSDGREEWHINGKRIK